MVTILFFGRLAEQMNCHSFQTALPAQVRTTEELAHWLDARTPGSEILAASTKAMINHELIYEAAILKDGDEVGFLPPVSGG